MEPLLVRAEITAKSDSSGRWKYAWDEREANFATGADQDPRAMRSGTVADNPAVEINDVEVPVGTIVWLKQRGYVGQEIWWEFAAPDGTAAGASCTDYQDRCEGGRLVRYVCNAEGEYVHERDLGTACTPDPGSTEPPSDPDPGYDEYPPADESLVLDVVTKVCPVFADCVHVDDDYQILDSDAKVIVDASGGAVTLTLPEWTTADVNFLIVIYDDANTITLEGFGSEFVNSGANVDITAPEFTIWHVHAMCTSGEWAVSRGPAGAAGATGATGATGPAGPAPSGTGFVRVTGGAIDARAELTGDVTTAGALVTTIAADAVTDAKLRNSAALSVIGRSANSTGDPADIAAASDHQVLRRSGTAVGFGAVDLSQSAAVTGTLGLARGGAGADLSGTGPGVLRQATAGATVTVGQALDYIHLRDAKAASTEGGTSSTGVQTRTLNTEVTDTGSNCSLSSNQFTLSAGTYRIIARAPCYQGNRHVAYLYNATAGAVILTGSAAYAQASTQGYNDSVIMGRFTVAASQALEIRHEIGTGLATQGLGVYGSATRVSVYTEVQLWKEVG